MESVKCDITSSVLNSQWGLVVIPIDKSTYGTKKTEPAILFAIQSLLVRNLLPSTRFGRRYAIKPLRFGLWGLVIWAAQAQAVGVGNAVVTVERSAGTEGCPDAEALRVAIERVGTRGSGPSAEG